jgi:hypothetical protein
LFGLAACLATGCALGFYFWAGLWGGRLGGPSQPAAAELPASARALRPPFRRESLDLTVGAREELNYRVGMQAGATLVYGWSTGAGRTGHGGEILWCECPGQKTIHAAETHGEFLAQSSGWYHWRWKNQSGNPVTIHLKLIGYYEEAGMPYDK